MRGWNTAGPGRPAQSGCARGDLGTARAPDRLDIPPWRTGNSVRGVRDRATDRRQSVPPPPWTPSTGTRVRSSRSTGGGLPRSLPLAAGRKDGRSPLGRLPGEGSRKPTTWLLSVVAVTLRTSVAKLVSLPVTDNGLRHGTPGPQGLAALGLRQTLAAPRTRVVESGQVTGRETSRPPPW